MISRFVKRLRALTTRSVRRPARSCSPLVAADVLEQRTLLSGTNPVPYFENVDAFEGMVLFELMDDDPGHTLTMHIDFANPNYQDQVKDVEVNFHLLELWEIIPPNSTESVSIHVVEEWADETGQGTQSSETLVLDVPGIIQNPIPITYHLTLLDGTILGNLDMANDRGGVTEMLMREAGTTAWTTVGEVVTDGFEFPWDFGDQTTTFEMSTRTTLYGVSVYGNVVTVLMPGDFGQEENGTEGTENQTGGGEETENETDPGDPTGSGENESGSGSNSGGSNSGGSSGGSNSGSGGSNSGGSNSGGSNSGGSTGDGESDSGSGSSSEESYSYEYGYYQEEEESEDLYDDYYSNYEEYGYA